jgi:hypothetical protein
MIKNSKDKTTDYIKYYARAAAYFYFYPIISKNNESIR